MGKKSAKNKEITIHFRIKEEEKQFIKDNLPVGIATISELYRIAGRNFIEHGTIVEEGGINAEQLSQLKRVVEESTEQIIKEVKSNRDTISRLISADEDARTARAARFKQAEIRELKRLWLLDPEIRNIRSMKQLQESVPFDHLRSVAFDTLEEMMEEGYITLSMRDNDTITWSEEK